MDGDVIVVKPKGAKETGEAEPVPDKAKPVMLMKHSRGRLGGRTALLTFAQRAMWHGRDVQIIDGDLKSQTLMNYYPLGTKGGAIVPTDRLTIGGDQAAIVANQAHIVAR